MAFCSTAIATVVALVPLAIGLRGSGGLISQSLAVVVKGGLISSTVLTLVVIPVVTAWSGGAPGRPGRPGWCRQPS